MWFTSGHYLGLYLDTLLLCQLLVHLEIVPLDVSSFLDSRPPFFRKKLFPNQMGWNNKSNQPYSEMNLWQFQGRKRRKYPFRLGIVLRLAFHDFVFLNSWILSCFLSLRVCIWEIWYDLLLYSLLIYSDAVICVIMSSMLIIILVLWVWERHSI